jgi:multidrug efflux pump subunit AcrA (membrane-fusion protein)
MSESIQKILEQSQSKKTIQKKWYYLGGIVLLIVITGIWWWNRDTKQSTPYVAEIHTVEIGSIETKVSSDGNIINPDIVNLSFLVNGTLKNLYVEEGQKVEADQLLAELDKQDLNFDVQSAENDVNIAIQNIRAKEAEITDLDIINAENDLSITLETTQNNLLAAEKNLILTQTENENQVNKAEQDFEQAFLDAKIIIGEAFFSMQDALTEVDYVFGIERNYGSKTISTLAFNDSINENNAAVAFNNIIKRLALLKKEYDDQKNTIAKPQVSIMVVQLQNINQEIQDLLSVTVSVFDSANANSNITEETIASSLSSIQGYQSKSKTLSSSLQQTKNNIDSTYLTLQNTYASTRNKLESAEIEKTNTLNRLENENKTANLRLDNAKKTVNKAEISKQANLNIQYAQLDQARLRVEKAKYELSLADLKAPKSGTIISLSASEGESLKSDTTSSENAFIKILSDANFTTEVFVEEADIAKIEIDQTARITLEAIPDLELIGNVEYVASTATKDSNGIITYLVRITIKDDQDQPIREGMTTYVDFITGGAKDVIVVPSKAIQQGRFVINQEQERVRVETGFSDGDFTEIKSGLSKGDTIILNPQSENNQSGRGDRTGGGSGRELTEERIAQFKQAGFTDDEIKKLQSGQFTDAMRQKMQKLRTGGGNGGGRPR